MVIRNITLGVPADSRISSGMKEIKGKRKEPLNKLHDVAYYIALKGRRFTDFKDFID